MKRIHHFGTFKVIRVSSSYEMVKSPDIYFHCNMVNTTTQIQQNFAQDTSDSDAIFLKHLIEWMAQAEATSECPQTRLTGVNQPIDFTCILTPHKCDRPEKRYTQGTPYNYVILQGLTHLAHISSMQKLYVNSSHFLLIISQFLEKLCILHNQILILQEKLMVM